MAVINILGTQFSDLTAKIFSGLKLVGLALIIGVGLFFGSPARTGFQLELRQSASTTDPGIGWAGAFGLAFVGVYFSVGGWQHASYLAGEARNPRRTVPRAMILGAIVVGVVYWLANLGYMFLLPVDRIAKSTGVAAEALQTVLPFGAVLISIMIALSALGTVGINTYSVPADLLRPGRRRPVLPGLRPRPPALQDAGQRHHPAMRLGDRPALLLGDVRQHHHLSRLHGRALHADHRRRDHESCGGRGRTPSGPIGPSAIR